MNKKKKKILSFLLATVILGSNNNVEATDYETIVQEEVMDEIVINSENIKNYIKNKYDISRIDSSNIDIITSISLYNFNQNDLNELSKFKNLKHLYLLNGTINDSSFLCGLDNLNSLYMFTCKINDLTYLKDTNITSLDIGECYLTNDLIEFFPSTLTKLRLFKERTLNDLSILPYYCPNIKDLSVTYCSGIVNLSFIYGLENLKIFKALETPACTENIYNYITSFGISTSLSMDDVNNNKKLNEILDSIITEDMTDREKVQSICLYIKQNIKKVLFDFNSSLHEPLSTILERDKGTYQSFSYLANTLFNMAGINSFELNIDNHSWNLIEIDNKYYYNDMSESFCSFLINWFDVGIYYMQDPANVWISKMKELEELGLSNDFIEEVNVSNESKTFSEKYLSNMALNIVYFMVISYAIYSLGKKSSNKMKKLKK